MIARVMTATAVSAMVTPEKSPSRPNRVGATAPPPIAGVFSLPGGSARVEAGKGRGRGKQGHRRTGDLGD